MSNIKQRMTEVQDEAIAAFQDWVATGGDHPTNPYVGTMWESVWAEEYDKQLKAYEQHLDNLADSYYMQRQLEVRV